MMQMDIVISDDAFNSQIKALPSTIHDVDIRFTGDVLPDNPIGPVLWRISETGASV